MSDEANKQNIVLRSVKRSPVAPAETAPAAPVAPPADTGPVASETPVVPPSAPPTDAVPAPGRPLAPAAAPAAAAESKQNGLLFELVAQVDCPLCKAAVKLDGAQPLTSVPCTSCGSKVMVPGRLGGFLLHGHIGEGEMGSIYRATDESLQREVAVKLVRGCHAEDTESLERLRREACAAGKLNHPRVAQVYALNFSNGHPFLVMELVDGLDFARKLEREGRIDERAVLRMALDVADGLSALNREGLVHGDIKPGNIVLDRDGNAKLVDFGLSGMTRFKEGSLVGTPNYIAPELLRGSADTHRSDLYSLGATLYHLLAGKLPIEGERTIDVLKARLTTRPTPLVSHARHVSAATRKLIMRMIDPDPEKRQVDSDAVAAELREALAKLDGPAAPAPAAAPLSGSVAAGAAPYAASPAPYGGSSGPAPYMPGGPSPYAPGRSPYGGGGPAPYMPGAAPYAQPYAGRPDQPHVAVPLPAPLPAPAARPLWRRRAFALSLFGLIAAFEFGAALNDANREQSFFRAFEWYHRNAIDRQRRADEEAAARAAEQADVRERAARQHDDFGYAALAQQPSGQAQAAERQPGQAPSALPPAVREAFKLGDRAWQAVDLGAGLKRGSYMLTGGALTLGGAGTEMWQGADNCRFAHTLFSGDYVFSARVKSLARDHELAVSAMLVKSENLWRGPGLLFGFLGSGHLVFQIREANRTTVLVKRTELPLSAPLYLRLARSGEEFCASFSEDGRTWQVFGQCQFALPPCNAVGFAVSSAQAAHVLDLATFDHVSLAAPGQPAAAPPPAAVRGAKPVAPAGKDRPSAAAARKK